MSFIFESTLLYIVYLLLVWKFPHPELSEFIVGLLISIAITIFIPVKLFGQGRLFKRAVAFKIFIFNFFIEMAVANIDVARRVIDPRLPIKPGIIKYKMKVKNSFARVLLANSITLTPGTLSIEMNDDTLYIHCIDVKDDSEDNCEDTTQIRKIY